MPKKAIILSFFFILAVMTPYFYGFLATDSNFVFGGFISNPIDGNSYLAKMQLGSMGQWRFQLLYSPIESPGGFLFLFYIFLGYLARMLGTANIIVYHAARLAACIYMVYAIYQFLRHLAADEVDIHLNWGLCLLLFGSGLGWIVSLFGVLPLDYWVAEMYPFLSGYSAPHFALGIGLFLDGIRLVLARDGEDWKILVLGLLLAVVMPFGLVLAGCLLSGTLLWDNVRTHSVKWSKPAIFIIPGGVFVVYQYLATISDPMLALWNAQNITPAPEFWKLFLSLSPALFFAIPGLKVAWKHRESTGYRFLSVWLVVGLALVYFPFPLQRRFLFAYFIPVAVLAMVGLGYLLKQSRRMPQFRAAVCGISVLTNLVVLVMGVFGINSRSNLLFITKDEADSYAWIKINTPENATILCSSESGLFLPAYTGRHVVYGHPFESVRAAIVKPLVDNFYQDTESSDSQSLLKDYRIQYILYGPREAELGNPPILDQISLLYANETVHIYKIAP